MSESVGMLFRDYLHWALRFLHHVWSLGTGPRDGTLNAERRANTHLYGEKMGGEEGGDMCVCASQCAGQQSVRTSRLKEAVDTHFNLK